jgi:hypothetical protein
VIDDIGTLLDDPLFKTTCTLISAQATLNKDGSITRAEQSTQIDAVVQPASTAETKHLTGGDETKTAISIWAKTLVKPTFGGTLAIGDKVLWHGHTYKVVGYEDWADYGYFEVLAVRISHDKRSDASTN